MIDGFSVIICCYNSASRIEKTLYHLTMLKIVPNTGLEIILIDNNSNDKTAQIALHYWSSAGGEIPLRIINELRPGQKYARESGVREAIYDIVIFCDDDNHLSEQYLIEAWNSFQLDPMISAVGGIGKAVSDMAFPEWFDNYKRAYACGIQNDKSGVVNKAGAQLYGAGLCVKRQLILDIYRSESFVLSGRTSTAVMSGDDSEICFKIVKNGFLLYYNEDLKFDHFIDPNRLTWNYLHKLYWGFGFSHYYLFPMECQALGKHGVDSFPGNALLKYLRTDSINVLRYLCRGAVNSITLKGAWLSGLLRAYFLDMCRSRL
jgi:glycosyltransferase involved in cell wall biosynthesis